MIGGSEKRNCEGGFELQPPLVFEKRSNPQKREFSLLLNIPRSRYSVLGYNRDFKIQRRGRQRERQKNNWLN